MGTCVAFCMGCEIIDTLNDRERERRWKKDRSEAIKSLCEPDVTLEAYLKKWGPSAVRAKKNKYRPGTVR